MYLRLMIYCVNVCILGNNPLFVWVFFFKIKLNYLKLLGLQISMRLLENLSFVNILFIGKFLWSPPPKFKRRQFMQTCLWRTIVTLFFLNFYDFLKINLLNQTVLLFFVIMIWYFFTTFYDVWMTIFHSCIWLSVFVSLFLRYVYYVNLSVNVTFELDFC